MIKISFLMVVIGVSVGLFEVTKDFYPQMKDNEFETNDSMLKRINQWIIDNPKIIILDRILFTVPYTVEKKIPTIWIELVATNSDNDKHIRYMQVTRYYYLSSTLPDLGNKYESIKTSGTNTLTISYSMILFIFIISNFLI